MELRTKTGTGAILTILLLSSGPWLPAQTATVQHRHFRKSGVGELRVTDTGIVFSERGKTANHSRVWNYQEIQQLHLGLDELRILTYEDQTWKLGLDREYVLAQLPGGFAQSVSARLRDQLEQRFVTSLDEPASPILWAAPVKLTGRIQGSQGALRVTADHIVYTTGVPWLSRTWRYDDIENIASAHPFDLSIVTRERNGLWNSGAREFRFQLKQPLTEARFNELWRRLNRTKEMDFIRTSRQEKDNI